MTARILPVSVLAEEVRNQAADEATALTERGAQPRVVAVLPADNMAAARLAGEQGRACDAAGVRYSACLVRPELTAFALRSRITDFLRDETVSGVCILPGFGDRFRPERLDALVPPRKDVAGRSPSAVGEAAVGGEPAEPLARAVIAACESHGTDWYDAEVVVAAADPVFGAVLTLALRRRHAVVAQVPPDSAALPEYLARATAAVLQGCARESIDASRLREDALLVETSPVGPGDGLLSDDAVMERVSAVLPAAGLAELERAFFVAGAVQLAAAREADAAPGLEAVSLPEKDADGSSRSRRS